MRVRIATFNVENLDRAEDERDPTLAQRRAVMVPQLVRLQADVLCLQEVHGQEPDDGERRLLALDALLDGTGYEGYHRALTHTTGGEAYDQRNLVVLSRFPIEQTEQYRNDLVPPPEYRQVTRRPRQDEAQPVRWQRPVLHTRLRLPFGEPLHVVNVHLKSRRPTPIAGQRLGDAPWAPWRSAAGWAEGFFLSSMKRVGQAFEVRRLVDDIFDDDEDALLVVAGDFNAAPGEVPVQTIAGGDMGELRNPELAPRILVPTVRSIPESARYTLIYQGQRELLDHLLVSRPLLAGYRDVEIHNETLSDESLAFATDRLFPESDHAPVVASFELPAVVAPHTGATARPRDRRLTAAVERPQPHW